MTDDVDHEAMLRVAIDEARRGLAEGGIPIGAAIFSRSGELLGAGHNRRIQENDPSVHAETDAFRKAGRQRSYRDTIMVTTLAPCWYCSGLVRQFGIGTVIVGESVNFQGGVDWLRASGVEVIDLGSQACVQMLADYIGRNPEVWSEDIGHECAVADQPATDRRTSRPGLDGEEAALWRRVGELWELFAQHDERRIRDALHPHYLGWDMNAPLPHARDAAVRSASGTSAALASYDLEPLGVRVYDDAVGVVHYRYVAMLASAAGAPSRVSGKWTEVYLKRDERWLMVAVSGRPDDGAGGACPAAAAGR
ncbi:MAG TPA: deaminase [Zeimonas sp.]|nr:deaminase [Zeimonas sp.]